MSARFGDRSFYKRLALLALPIILQNMITIGVNITDTIMLGSFGEAQLSASSLANQYSNIFQILCLGIGGGASVMTAQFWGTGDTVALKRTMALMLRVCMVVAVCFTLVAVLFPAGIMRVYTPDPAIIEQGVKYFTFLSWTFLLNGIALTLSIVLRSVGSPHVPLLASIGSFLLNVLFNWVFIFGRLGAPRLEIQGAAIGTLMARAFEVAVICGYLLLRDRRIRFGLRDLLLDCGPVTLRFVKFSVPVIVSDLLLALGDNALSMIMGRMGTEYVSANAITMVVVRLASVFCMGLSSASAVITGNTLGEGDVEKAYREGIGVFLLGGCIGLVGSVFIILLSPWVIDYYNISGETREVARQFMLAIGTMFLFRAMSSVTTKGVLRGGGDTRFLMVADVLFLWLVSIPLGYLGGLVWALPPFWVYVIFRSEFVFKSVWCLFRFKSRKWIQSVG